MISISDRKYTKAMFAKLLNWSDNFCAVRVFRALQIDMIEIYFVYCTTDYLVKKFRDSSPTGEKMK